MSFFGEKVIKGPFRKFSDTSDSWQMMVHESLKIAYPFPWLIISAILYLACVIVIKPDGEETNFYKFLGLLCLLIAAVNNSIVYYEKLLDEVADKYTRLLDGEDHVVKEWVNYWYQKIFWSRWDMAWGLGFAIVFTMVYLKWEIVDIVNLPNKVCYIVVMAVLWFSGGSSFWIVVCIARMFRSMGRDIKVRQSIFDSRTSALRRAAAITWKVALVSTLIFILGVFTPVICGVEYTQASMIITVGFGAFVVGYFIFSQVNIHKNLVEIKQEKIDSLVEKLDRAFDEAADNPGKENIQKLQDLLELQRVVDGRSEWSFGTKDLFSLVTTIMSPLIVYALTKIIEKIIKEWNV